MAKLTPEERAELEARLRDDDDDDDSEESEIGFADGSYFRGRHRRVTEVAAARGVKLRPDPEPEEEPAKGKKLQAAPEPRRFGGRRVS